MSEAAKRVILLAISLLVGLLSLEIAVRIIEPREVLREYFQRPDPVLHHRFIAGGRGFHKTLEFNAAYAINSVGLRNEEIPLAKPAGTRRILMLGDSFTEGNGVNAADTFSSRLQARLDRGGLGNRWRVINAGVGSYSPLLEYLYLKNGGLELQPDLVVLNLDLSDAYDDIQYTALAEMDASGDPVAVRPDPQPPKPSPLVRVLVGLKDFLKKNTRTYNFVRRRIAGFVESGRHKVDVSGDVRFDKYAMLRESGGTAAGDGGWTVTYGYLLRIRDLLAARGIDFWVTVYPYGLQISPREWGTGRIFWGFEPGKVYSTRPQAIVERFGRDHGIPVINMTPDFEERSRTLHPLYYDGDGHWLPAGHDLVAEVLHRRLVPYVEARDARSPSPP